MFLKKDIIYSLLIFIIAFLLTADLFIHTGQPVTFDGTTHITTIAQFYTGLSQGQFPVTWADNFANYGMPIPLIAQQTTNYIAGFLTFITHDVLVSQNLVYFLGAFLSTIFYYRFLRFYFTADVAFLGAFLFNFSSYRIINIYIRGALPEFFAPVFIPLTLIGLYQLYKGRLHFGITLTIFSVAMIIFTHPFMFVISLFFIGPYSLFLLLQTQKKRSFALLISLCVILGVGITAAYTIPLFTEVKYFYYGLTKNHLVPNQFLGLQNYFDPSWYYYYKNDVFVRGNFLQFGLIETVIVILGFILVFYYLSKRKVSKNKLLYFAVIVSLLIILFTTSYTAVLYNTISLLNGIQYPWRLLGVFIFLPPLILCLLIKNINYQPYIIAIIILVIAFARFPQIYGKNFTVYPQEKYFFTAENLHGNILNTVWTGKTLEYPIKKTKPYIIDGKGQITTNQVKNGFRDYQINAETKLRMADYTFYFPGWRVYVDGQKMPIEYQDPNYRGVITYEVPQGNHHVMLQFEQTADRIAGEIITILCLIVSGFLIYAIQQFTFLKRFFAVTPKAGRR
jgi:hypothetical protein